MKKNVRFYAKLFFSTLQLSAFTFGGGFVIVSLMRKKFVEQLGWLEEQEMLDFTAIAQSSPGAIAVNASILIGYRLAGFPGAMLTVLATILPPLVLLTFLSYGYLAFRDSQFIQYILRGMRAGVAAIIADVVISMGIQIGKSKRILTICLMLLSFAAVALFHLNVMLVILFCGLAGCLEYASGKKGRDHDLP